MRIGTWLLAVGALAPAAGCVTHRDKVACRRAELYAAARGEGGDALGAAVGREMAAANVDLGADVVAAEEARLDAAAAEANAAAIGEARAARGVILAAGRNVLDALAQRVPAVGAALGVAYGLLETFRRRRQQAEEAEASEVAGWAFRLVARLRQAAPEQAAAVEAAHAEAELPGMVTASAADLAAWRAEAEAGEF